MIKRRLTTAVIAATLLASGFAVNELATVRVGAPLAGGADIANVRLSVEPHQTWHTHPRAMVSGGWDILFRRSSGPR